jgi:hypothetical protein
MTNEKWKMRDGKIFGFWGDIVSDTRKGTGKNSWPNKPPFIRTFSAI